MDIKTILELAQGLPNEFLVNELRKHCEEYMKRRTEPALRDVITSCAVIVAKYEAGDTKASLEKAVKDFDILARGKKLLTTYEN